MNDLTSLHLERDFIDNTEPRCPCVLLLDTSASMNGDALLALNAGIREFKRQLVQDPLAMRRVEVAIVTFNSTVTVIQEFVTPDIFDPPKLIAEGLTHMAEGIHMALSLIYQRKAQYRQNGIAYYRPWVFLITDGEPQGEEDSMVESAAERIREEEAHKQVAFFGVGVERANMKRLQHLLVRTPLKLHGLNFRDMFIWLSASMKRVSLSQTDDMVALPPAGWGSI